MITLQHIREARQRISGAVVATPCPLSIPLSEETGMQIYCKLDYLQRTGSFKERGARNALLALSDDQKKRGVIAASAGNHALGLSYHARLLGIPATVIMPRFAPLTKVSNCRRFGAKVVLEGANIGEAKQYADGIATQCGYSYVNGYDDLPIIAGQGTMALEILEQVPDLDAIIVPIGGGGLIAGIAVAVKNLRPEVKIIGVEPQAAASFSAALAAGHPVLFDMQPTLADGLSVPRVGDNAFAIGRNLIDRIVLVREPDIARAVLRLMELEKAVVEGAGAAPLAACLSNLLPELAGKKVVLPLCGGNIDLTTLDRVIERGLASDGRLCRFTATISDRPGGLARFASVVAGQGASIIDINHDRVFADADDITTVAIHCVVETRDADHIRSLLQHLNSAGFRVR